MTAAQGLAPTPISLKPVFLQHWRVRMRAPAFLNLGILIKFYKITFGFDNKRKICSFEIQINKLKKRKGVAGQPAWLSG